MYRLMCKMLLAGLLMALVGCATRTEYVRELPPLELLEDCKATQSEVKTNGQLALALLAARDDLAKCNIDKKALRDWAR